MDDTVNDFLKEINEIVPPKEKKSENPWKECFDERSGFSYYWNLDTDEVTWEMPDDYRSHQDKNRSKKGGLYIPPKSLPSTPLPVITDPVKIYKIGLDTNKAATTVAATRSKVAVKKPPIKKQAPVDSDDEKITLISSYGGDTDSDEDEEISRNKKFDGDSHSDKQDSSVHQGTKDIESEEHILKKLQNKAKELKDLGGEVPADVKKLVGGTSSEGKREISGFKLVAGYSSDEESEDEIAERANEKPELAPAALFPIKEERSCEQLKVEKPTLLSAENTQIDSKAFQRKRKIDIDIVNAQNKPKEAKVSDASEQQALDFKPSTTSDYLGFKSGGVMFVKSETLNLSNSETSSAESVNKEQKVSLELEETRTTLSEKLSFLSEGHASVSPVQTMLIQVETLYVALKDGSLTHKYFEKWLSDTCTDLIKLEKEAAPSGWLLQWDRSNKRYFYQNKSTGESQWEYPQPDVIRCDEAMDICTTPPPPPAEEDEASRPSAQKTIATPPPPPKIRKESPVPPPPPVISSEKGAPGEREGEASQEKPHPFPPLPVETYNEPLPPGVDRLDVDVSNVKATSSTDTLSSALNSFYSEMATISTTTEQANVENNGEASNDTAIETVKKKKKSKVKIAQGLAMKKKGVSKLVEKWKNVQKNY